MDLELGLMGARSRIHTIRLAYESEYDGNDFAGYIWLYCATSCGWESERITGSISLDRLLEIASEHDLT